MRVLTVNAGSSSLKLRLLGDADELLAGADLPALAGRAASDELARAVAGMPEPGAVGHRVVHGGTRCTTSSTRWKRSRSLSTTMSNGVVVVPSSL